MARHKPLLELVSVDEKLVEHVGLAGYNGDTGREPVVPQCALHDVGGVLPALLARVGHELVAVLGAGLLPVDLDGVEVELGLFLLLAQFVVGVVGLSERVA